MQFGRSSISRAPAPKPDDSIVIAGIGPKLEPQAASIAAPVGVVSSTLDVPSLGRDPLQQPDDCRGRVGQQTVGAADHPEPGGNRAGRDRAHSEQLEGGGGADDVHDGVVTSDLVEVHLRRRPTMEPALDLGEQRERGDGAIAHTVGEPRLLEDAHHVGEGPDDAVAAHLDDRPGGGDAVAKHGLEFERPSADREPVEQAFQLAKIGAGVDEAAQRHVAGDTGEAVEPGDPTAGRAGHRRILATAQAAPKPLSMPTTVIPAAHEACMASNAVTPSSEEP